MRQKTPIAVVGMAGVFPGAADLESYWNNIVNRISAIADVPKGRWILPTETVVNPAGGPDKAFSKRAGLIHNFTFDPADLNVNAELLMQLDPMYHLVLTAGREALAECRITEESKQKTGVILAAIALPTDTSSLFTRNIMGKAFETSLFGNEVINSLPALTKTQCIASRVTSLPASLLARAFDLGGGTYTLDAACSSSLYSIKLACDELWSGRSDVMVAGGVSRPESLFTQTGFTQLTALSPTGICAPFDKSANGLVVGEGAGIIVLKRLDNALRDGDTIHALIHGAGLSNDIGGNLLAPDTNGQIRAMRLAYESAGWSPFDVDHIECHGTGTPVGDTIELKSLRALWGDSGWETNQCGIGSVKSMIGHLLTGAGIAGTIKTILGLKHKILPPSLNYQEPVDGSPLIDGPFRVQTTPDEWKTNGRTPRRAAMSAFGFGGINAHVLVEEWESGSSKSYAVPETIDTDEKKSIDIAVIGMGTVFGSINTLSDFQTTVLNGTVHTDNQATNERWRGCSDVAEKHFNGSSLPMGNYLNGLPVSIGEFHIPPNEIQDILPQHLLMLKAAAQAMEDANLPKREDRPRMGTAIGMGFDFEATNFNVRWNIEHEVDRWNSENNLGLSDAKKQQWQESLKDACHPPLTPSRTTGALGGIIASRVAKEFRFGGPSFIVSCEDSSGMKAIDIGVRSIQNNETDTFLAGAVDLPGEIRNLVASNSLRPYSNKDKVYPFDIQASGTLPGDGAAAIVLKSLDRAIEDGDRIYAVIKGIGNAASEGIDTSTPSETAYTDSLNRALMDAGADLTTIDYVETHGSGSPDEDKIEATALNTIFSENGGRYQTAIGSLTPTIGHTGAVAGLASVVKSCLALYQEIIPPLPTYTESDNLFTENGPFHIPSLPQYWMKDKTNGPRRACVASMTTDGNCSHIILEQAEQTIADTLQNERLSPLGDKDKGLFIIEGNTQAELLSQLDTLESQIQTNTSTGLHIHAADWNTINTLNPEKSYCVSIIAGETRSLSFWINEAKNAVIQGVNKRFNGPDGISYSPLPLGKDSEIAFVYPGSGNHYVGMGRGIGTTWPEILRKLDNESSKLKSQLLPASYYPHGVSWIPEWETRAMEKLNANPWETIVGQVSHGVLVTDLIQSFSITPSAVLSYSLGESSAFFGTRTWPDRDDMFARMEETDLFSEQLAGNCSSLRKQWQIPEGQDVQWRVACVNRTKEEVTSVIDTVSHARLLIVNSPNECVIGGLARDVETVIDTLKCDPVYLDGVITVHCDAAKTAADDYKKLHILETTPPEGLRFYGCNSAEPYEVTEQSAADSVLAQALSGFDFTKTVNRAYEDGVRIFIEAGPAASCTRMIDAILENRPHLAISACVKGEDDYLTVLKLAGSLLSERVPISLEPLYGQGRIKSIVDPVADTGARTMTVMTGGTPPNPPKPPVSEPVKHETVAQTSKQPEPVSVKQKPTAPPVHPNKERPQPTTAKRDEIRNRSVVPKNSPVKPYVDMIEPFTKTIEETAKAHNRFLEFSESMSKSFADTLNFQTNLIEKAIISGNPNLISNIYIEAPFVCDLVSQQGDSKHPEEETAPILEPEILLNDTNFPEKLNPIPVEKKLRPAPAYSRDMCMEFAIGSLGKVLGPGFAIVDTYNVRVRLPDEPLMLVDRILTVEGEKGSLKSGKVVTEHDVKPDAWYLDGGRAPVCISIEAGQADLFLCSYLGIDLAVKGKRSYRLLDAVAKFHSGLPKPGDTIRYEIEIDRFINQGETYLFFFHFNGFLGNKHIISMRNGCAGFFTEQEVKDSGGIVLTPEETAPIPGVKPPDWTDLVDFFDCTTPFTLSDAQVDALRNGDAETAFGPLFKGKHISPSISIPGGRMKLVDRVLSIDPKGGRYGLGSIKAQADIHPDDWFLTCHFVDDMVMPGTLMYECCMHTLRIFTMRMGWISDKVDICCEPVPEIESVLKCRGPVTVETKHVFYVVEIKEIGYAPEPFVIADAHMYAHDQHIVMFRDMSMKISGLTKADIESYWKR